MPLDTSTKLPSVESGCKTVVVQTRFAFFIAVHKDSLLSEALPACPEVGSRACRVLGRSSLAVDPGLVNQRIFPDSHLRMKTHRKVHELHLDLPHRRNRKRRRVVRGSTASMQLPESKKRVARKPCRQMVARVVITSPGACSSAVPHCNKSQICAIG